VLGHSRLIWARFVLHQDMQTVLRCHMAAFEAIGGVPKEILYDRMKTAVIGEGGGSIVYNRALIDFARHYGFQPKACRPYRAKTKGKVERPYRYIREDFFLARSFRNLDDLNAQLRHWLDTVANPRVHATTLFGDQAYLADAQSFAAYLAPLHNAEWVVYAKRPFGGPEAVLAYLSRYTHRVAIANSRLIAFDQQGVTFKWKDYRIAGRDRYKTMTLGTDEFIRRFLIHVLPKGLHRIRHYGLFAKGACAGNIVRGLLGVESQPTAAAVDPDKPSCPCCGGRMIIIEVFARGATPRHQPTTPMNRIRIDTS
jgi:hypothetical protein